MERANFSLRRTDLIVFLLGTQEDLLGEEGGWGVVRGG